MLTTRHEKPYLLEPEMTPLCQPPVPIFPGQRGWFVRRSWVFCFTPVATNQKRQQSRQQWFSNATSDEIDIARSDQEAASRMLE